MNILFTTLKKNFVSPLVSQRDEVIRERFNDDSSFRRLYWGDIFGDKNSFRGLHNHYAIHLNISIA